MGSDIDVFVLMGLLGELRQALVRELVSLPLIHDWDRRAEGAVFSGNEMVRIGLRQKLTDVFVCLRLL